MIYYLKEHAVCRNYKSIENQGFVTQNADKNNEIKSGISMHRIFFVLKGKVLFGCEQYGAEVAAGNMCFCCKGCNCQMRTVEDTRLLVASFNEITLTACEQAHLGEVNLLNTNDGCGTRPLPIRSRLRRFIDSLLNYLGDGANCVHFHEMKIKELFWALRFYYKKEELASFFYIPAGYDTNFRIRVSQLCKETNKVQDMANAMGMSVSGFKRKFEHEFGIPSGQWIQERLLEEIQIRLADRRSPLKNIADDLHFPSLADFSKYCKRHLGLTPTRIRELEIDKIEQLNQIEKETDGINCD